MLVELAAGHFLGRPHDCLAGALVDLPEAHVHAGGRQLDDPERPDEGRRHPLAADPEVLEAALRLGPPVPGRLDLDRTEGVRLDTHGALAGHD